MLFNSCENFLNGSDLSEKIQTQIEYEIANPCLVTISTDNGKITNAGSYKLKPTDQLTIEYSENNSGYQFFGWSCVPENAVSFSDINSSKTTITILNSNSDITITPVIYERLKVTSVYPDTSKTEYSRDSTITIEFSKPLSKDNDLSSIKILNGNDNLVSCFNEPILIENKIIFTANRSNLIPIEEGTQKNITVTIPSSFYYEEKDKKLSLASDYTFSYAANSKLDEKAPDISYLTVSNAYSSKVLTQGTFNQFINDIGIDNFFTIDNVVSSLKIDFKTSDSESGISAIKIVDNLLYDVNGISSTGAKYEDIIYINQYCSDNYNAEGSLTYTFLPYTKNGITELQIIFVDNCGNESVPFTYSFIKKQSFYNTSMCMGLGYDSLQGLDSYPDCNQFDMADWIDSDKYVSINYFEDDLYATYNGKCYYDSLYNFDVKIELFSQSGNLIETVSEINQSGTEETKTDGQKQIYYVYKFQNCIKDEDSFYRLTVKDSVGNTKTVEREVYATPQLLNVIYKEVEYKGTENQPCYLLDFNYNKEFDCNDVRIWYSYDNQTFKSYSCDENYDYEPYKGYCIPVTSNQTTVYLYINICNNFCNFSDLYTITGDMVSTPSNNANMKPSFNYEYYSEPVVNSTRGILKIEFSEEDYSKYDSLTLNITDTTGAPSYSNTITTPEYYFYKEDYILSAFKFYVTGKKGNTSYDSDRKPISGFTISQADYMAPKIDKIKGDTYRNLLKVSILDYPAEDINNLLDENGNVKLYVANLGFNYSEEYIYSLSKEQALNLPYEEYSLKPTYESDSYYLYIPLTKYKYTYEEYKRYGNSNPKFVVLLKDKYGNYDFARSSKEFYYKKEIQYPFYDTSTNKLKTIIYDGGSEYFSWIALDSTSWNAYKELEEYLSAYKNLPTSNSPFFRFINTLFGIETFDRPLYCVSERKTCEIKELDINHGSLNDSVTLFIDQPAFIHRLVCSENFGSDIDMWERWTLQDNKQHEKVLPAKSNCITQFDYQNKTSFIETDSIPKGYYYCYVVYFSDNTCKMSDVYYKQ